MPALSVGNPLLSEKLENMSSIHCYEVYILCFISIIPSPLTSCPMPLRGTVNLILQYSPLHLLPLSFFSSLLFFLARTFCCYRSKSVPGLIFAGGKERRLGLGLPSTVNRDYLCAVLFWRTKLLSSLLTEHADYLIYAIVCLRCGRYEKKEDFPLYL